MKRIMIQSSAPTGQLQSQLEILASLPFELLLDKQQKLAHTSLSAVEIVKIQHSASMEWNRFKDIPLKAIMESKKLRLSSDYRDCDLPGLMIRSELDCRDREIILYEKNLEELQQALSILQFSLCPPEIVHDIAITHELFHYLQYEQGCVPGSLAGEAGAHLFAQYYLGLSFYPWVLDVVQVVHRYPDKMEFYQGI